MSSNTERVTPQIYVACVATYSQGKAHGIWIDLDVDADEIREAIAAMLSKSPVAGAEEWAILGSEGIDGYTPESIEAAAALGELIEKHDLAPVQWVRMGHAQGLDPDQWEEYFGEQYQGEWSSQEEYVEESLMDNGTARRLENILIGCGNAWDYLDMEAIARDWFLSDFYSVDMGSKVYVFSR